MTERDRAWLRGFLHLDAGARSLTVPTRDVERQEDTVLRALTLLDTQPGVVLADEVGMGKTYEALGVIAARDHQSDTAKTLVLTPGPDLNTKWKREFGAFASGDSAMYRPFAGHFEAVKTLREFVKHRDKKIIIAPVTMFQGTRAMDHNCYLLSLFFVWTGVHHKTRDAAFRRYREAEGRALPQFVPCDVREESFLDEVAWSEIEGLRTEVLGEDGSPQRAKIAESWEKLGLDYFANREAVEAGLADLRFRLIRELIPEVDLLVIDEAHKLKNAASVRATAVRQIFDGRFEKALFLTATPFQLEVDELRQVLHLFSLARSASPGEADRAGKLLSDIGDYKAAYADFEAAWRRLDGGADSFREAFLSDPTLERDVDSPALAHVVREARRLLYLGSHHVPFFVELLREAKRSGLDVTEMDGAALFTFMPSFWKSETGRGWVERIGELLKHLDGLDETRRQELLRSAFSAGQFVRHTADGESRERLREAFNTPLFPMVLVANEVMQEGLDLHHHCARVVHHDLAWNPAQLEQRVGRVDRLGSRLQRQRALNPDAKLDVLYPLIEGTIDIRLDRTVRAREKWMEFLLGAAPNLDEYALDDEEVAELPAEFAEALKIDLGPRMEGGDALALSRHE